MGDHRFGTAAALVALGSAAVLPLACSSEAEPATAPILCENPSSELFERRIAPLLADDQPSSCNQCHLSGVDLGALARKDPCETMACMLQDGLVDLKRPESSKVLSWIQRAEPESELITQEVIDLEYQAMLEWIQAESECRGCGHVRCEELEDAPLCDPSFNPAKSADTSAFEADCSDKAMEALFMETVYASRGRCYPCHFTSNTSIKAAPKWIDQNGSCAASSLATLRNIIDSGYVDVDEPENSLLLLKPLSEAQGGVEHGGHDKILKADVDYENFLAWLRHYADCQQAD